MKIAYICNLKRFCNDGCGCIANGGECSHTLDVTFAKNYDEVPLVTEDKNFKLISDEEREAYYYEEDNNGRN